MSRLPLLFNLPFLIRVLVGLFFAVSGVSKLARPYEEFLFVVQGYALLPPVAEDWLARVLPWIETIGGTFLLLGLWTRQALALTWALCTVFIAALGSVLYRQLNLDDCGCVAIGVSLSPRATLVIDCLVWIALLAGGARPAQMRRLSVDEYFESRRTTDGRR